MDKRVNVFNLSICCLNFFNSIFLLFFSGIFKLPGMVGGIMGVVWFFANAIFAIVLLVLVFASSCYAVFAKNPETRYQPMRDDRNSFIKSTANLNSTELDALGASARGDVKGGGRRPIDDDDDAFTNPPIAGNPQFDAQGTPLPPSTAGSGMARSHYEQDASSTLYPANNSRYQDDDGYSRSSGYSNNQHQQYGHSPVQPSNNVPMLNPSSGVASQRPRSPASGGGGNGYAAYSPYSARGNDQGYQGYNQQYGQQHPSRQSRMNDDYSWHPGNKQY